MPEIMPPQFAGVQQRPFYVKARTVITAVSVVWLVLAVAGYGSFSGGTTSLALSLALMYGTGIAILVVASAVYRMVKRSAVRRTESAPEDAAAAAFVDATRFAAEELRSALTPARAGVRPAASALPAAAQQRPAGGTVFREPGAQELFARESPAALPAGSPKKSGGSKPAAGKPAVSKSAVSKPAVNRPAVSKPAVNRPAGTPAANKPAASKSAVNKSAVNKKAASRKKKTGKPGTSSSQDLKRAA